MLETSLANQRLKGELESQLQLLATLVPKYQQLSKEVSAPQMKSLVTQSFDKVNKVGQSI
jgi:hypothetical protein